MDLAFKLPGYYKTLMNAGLYAQILGVVLGVILALCCGCCMWHCCFKGCFGEEEEEQYFIRKNVADSGVDYSGGQMSSRAHSKAGSIAPPDLET